jgi:type IV secretory pathway VirB10-like protein
MKIIRIITPNKFLNLLGTKRVKTPINVKVKNEFEEKNLINQLNVLQIGYKYLDEKEAKEDYPEAVLSKDIKVKKADTPKPADKPQEEPKKEEPKKEEPKKEEPKADTKSPSNKKDDKKLEPKNEETSTKDSSKKDSSKKEDSKTTDTKKDSKKEDKKNLFKK